VRLHEGWPHAEIRWYRQQASELQAEMDWLADPVVVARRIDDLAERRDMWLRMADELDEYRRDADHPDGCRRASNPVDLLNQEDES